MCCYDANHVAHPPNPYKTDKKSLAQGEAADEDAILAQASAWSVGGAHEDMEGFLAQTGADAETALALAQLEGW